MGLTGEITTILCQMRIVLNYLLMTYYYTHRVRRFFLFATDKNEQTDLQLFKEYSMRTVECAGLNET